MLISLGRRSQPEDLVALLSECHERIRSFLRLAEDVGRREDLATTDVVDVCEHIARYFGEALPLHVEDEERSLLPRLEGRGVELDRALGAMHAQHAEHEPLISALLEATRNVQGAPDDAPSRARLRSVAHALSAELERHLEIEEQVIFPAVRSLLSDDAQAQVVAELRSRRRSSRE